MNRKILFTNIVLLTTLILASCGSQIAPQTETPQMQPEVAAPTQTQIQPTSPAATEAPTTEAATKPAAETADAPVSFANDVMPIFERYCVNCHGVEKVKEGLKLLSYDDLMAGSFNGSVVTPGNPDESYLVELLVNRKMPKRGDKPTSEEVQIISDWVSQGALNN